MSRKNVLMIVADQWRADGIHGLGAAHVPTPTLDELVRDGMAFAMHFGQALPCGPSRASLFTSKYLMNHRVANNGTPMDRRHTTLALEARKVGYDPVLFGYTDTTLDPRGLPPNDPARRSYEGVLPGLTPGLVLREDPRPWLSWLKSLGYPADLDRYSVYRPRPGATIPAGRGASFAPPIYTAEHSDTAFLTNQALSWLVGNQDRPWMALLCYLRPHPPLIAPEPYNAQLDPADVPAFNRSASADEEARQHPYTEFMMQTKPLSDLIPEAQGLAAEADELELRQLRATHYGLMTELDAHVGRLIAHLKQTGQYDDTLIIFTSDHADELGDHYLFNQSSYFDEAVHVPLIIRDPDSPSRVRATVVQEFTEAIDVMPTILDWLGAELPTEIDGASLLPFLRGQKPKGWRDAVHWERDFRDVVGFHAERRFSLSPDQSAFAVIRDRDYKYIHFSGLPPAFYDLRDDPLERINRVDDPQMRGRVLEYAQRMLDWRMVHADRTLVNMMARPDGLVEWRGPRTLPVLD